MYFLYTLVDDINTFVSSQNKLLHSCLLTLHTYEDILQHARASQIQLDGHHQVIPGQDGIFRIADERLALEVLREEPEADLDLPLI